tara:strand:+ start:636 stop:1016 length:381 start_codon:yes stop_codon:yes gene_type:complete
MGVNTCMSLKLDPVDLMVYADVAQAFEGWLINNPEQKDEPKGITQSRVFAKSYLNLYVTFLEMFTYMPKDKIEYESETSEGIKRRFDDIDQLYTELQINTKLTKAETDVVAEGISKAFGRTKPTLH